MRSAKTSPQCRQYRLKPVNAVSPVASVYRWQGAVERAEEWTCSFKTTRAAQPALEAAVLARHPYQLPEIVAAPLEGSAAYLGWIEQSVFTGEG